jgi:riboflavin kinase/FMN adenylyltransferase
MQVFRGLPPSAQQRDCALAIGNFDGVHRGHRELLGRAVAHARAEGLVPAAMTFEPHPREFFAPDAAPARVANVRDKIAGLERAGIERVFIEHFDWHLASLPPEQFIDEVLVRRCRARWIVIGDDFRFGARRAGDAAMLQAHAARGGYRIERMDTVAEGGERISSSLVRGCLQAGDLDGAARLLGHPYRISGRVVHGARLGRALGFPTINLLLPRRRPAVHGIFAVRVRGLAGEALPGVASVGLRPTVADAADPRTRWILEVHLFDFDRQVYGSRVEVEFLQKLRDEQAFGSLDELVRAIGEDARRARELLGLAPAP